MPIMSDGYYMPSEVATAEITVDKSRFIAVCGCVSRTEDTKPFIHTVREQFPAATHYVYAYRIGHGNTITEGASDDGEPSGTSGPPVLAVIKGSDLGNIIIVVVRYFGGKKLGKGGLVRAYSSAAQQVLAVLNTEIKRELKCCTLEIDYANYNQVRKMLDLIDCEITNESFLQDVSIDITIPPDIAGELEKQVADITAGQYILEERGSSDIG